MKRIAVLSIALLLLPAWVTPVGAVPARRSAAARGSEATHVVRKGESLYTIARSHGLSVEELKRRNGLRGNALQPGQVLLLSPSDAPPSAQPGAAPRTHVVRKGESLYTIARSHGLSVEELKQLNRLDSDALQPGQTLLLAREGADKPAKPAAKAGKTSAARVHVVRKGENLSTIARKAGLSVNELKRLNGLKGNALKPGQRLALSRPRAEVPAAVAAETPDAGELLRREAAASQEQEELAGVASDPLGEAAFGFLATPYRFGGSSRKGIDCSSFVQQVFRQLDVKLPRSAREQYWMGSEVSREELQRGDLLFFPPTPSSLPTSASTSATAR
jgi:LysM repeat protein